MAKNPEIKKFCKNCGVQIERKYINGRIEDYRKYKARKYCSEGCYDLMRKKEAALELPPTKAELQEQIKRDILAAEELEDLAPLEFMLREMNRPSNSLSYRKEMAALAAPYMHPKLDAKSTKTKKEERAEAASKVTTGGRFAPTTPPKIVGRIG